MPEDTSAFRVGRSVDVGDENVMPQENVTHHWFPSYEATEGLHTPFVTVMEVY